MMGTSATRFIEATTPALVRSHGAVHAPQRRSHPLKSSTASTAFPIIISAAVCLYGKVQITGSHRRSWIAPVLPWSHHTSMVSTAKRFHPCSPASCLLTVNLIKSIKTHLTLGSSIFRVVVNHPLYRLVRPLLSAQGYQVPVQRQTSLVSCQSFSGCKITAKVGA